MTLDVERVCPACRRFWHGPPGRLRLGGPICRADGHALRRRPEPVVVVDRVTPLPVTLEATAGEVWAAETLASRIAARGARDVDSTPNRDPWEQDRDAFVAEQLVSRHYGEAWTGVQYGAVDVGGKWEVRSIVDPTHGLIIRPRDRDLPTFLVLMADRLGTILGWEHAATVRLEGDEKGSRYGSSRFRVLPQDRLRRDDP